MTSSEVAQPQASAWGAVICLALLCFTLVSSEFMPVSLLTPIATDLGISEGQAGQAIAISGVFAILTSLFGNAALSRLGRKHLVLLYTATMAVSGLLVTFAPNYLVFMLGRALIGVAVGGFWSLSTAILARMLPTAELAKGIAVLQGGTALATVLAAPLGSFLGGLIGWRGAFFVVVPVALIGFVWQLAILPPLAPEQGSSPRRMIGLLRSRIFALGMLATTLAFMGQFALSTYFRPFLETVTGLDITSLSLALLGLGIAGLAGTSIAGLILRKRLNLALVALPAILSVVAVLLPLFGSLATVTALLLIVWGFCSTQIPVAWNTWMSRVIPDELEAGGGLQVALIQFAIAFGAFFGGVLFDTAGWWSPFAMGAVLLAASALLAPLAWPVALAAKGK